MHETSRIDILVDFYWNIDEWKHEPFKIHILLQVGGLLENVEQSFFADFFVMLCFPFKLHNFDDIKVPTEQHKSIEGHDLKEGSNIIERISTFMLILSGKPTVMFEYDFELVFVHVDHLQGFFQYRFLLFQGKVIKRDAWLCTDLWCYQLRLGKRSRQCELICVRVLFVLTQVGWWSYVFVNPAPDLETVSQVELVGRLLYKRYLSFFEGP